MQSPKHSKQISQILFWMIKNIFFQLRWHFFCLCVLRLRELCQSPFVGFPSSTYVFEARRRILLPACISYFSARSLKKTNDCLRSGSNCVLRRGVSVQIANFGMTTTMSMHSIKNLSSKFLANFATNQALKKFAIELFQKGKIILYGS